MPHRDPCVAVPPVEFSTLRASDVMQRDLVVVHAGDPLHEVERVLADAQVSAVPVLGDDERVLGVVSVRDLVSRYAADQELPPDADPEEFADGVEETEIVAWQRPADGPCAGDVMTTDVVRVGADTLLMDVAARMVEHRAHRVLVTERQRLVGLVSTMDVLAALGN